MATNKLKNQLLAYMERFFNLNKRFWKWELVWITYTVLMALTTAFIASGVNAVSGADIDVNKVTLYLVIGSLLWGFLATILWEICSVILWERWEGTLEYTFMAPVNRLIGHFGTAICAVIYGLIKMFIVFVVILFVFDLQFSWIGLAGMFGVLFVSTFAFVGLGIFARCLTEKDLEINLKNLITKSNKKGRMTKTEKHYQTRAKNLDNMIDAMYKYVKDAYGDTENMTNYLKDEGVFYEAE